jgi:hypothetical protein
MVREHPETKVSLPRIWQVKVDVLPLHFMSGGK